MAVFFNTKIRKKLLGYLFSHIDEEFYVRELAALTLSDPGNLSRELRFLENEGLLLSYTKGKIKLYRLNKKYPLFDELKRIIFKTEGVAAALRALVAGFDEISSAYLYGSFAKNKEDSKSDIDLIVVGESIPLREFTRQARKVEERLNREVNFVTYTPEEFSVERKKNGSFLQITLKGPKLCLKGEGRE